MSDSTAQPAPQKTCAKCGKPVIDTGTGGLVHVGGGTMEQKCGNCGWSGGQAGGFSQCPRCGDETQLSNDHAAA
jgi:ribosomal protein S27AE